jgi:hypothetical protein
VKLVRFEGEKNGSYFGSCQGSIKEEIRGALSQPLQALRQASRFPEEI